MTTLVAILDEQSPLVDSRTEAGLNYVHTFERDGQRYQRRRGECDVEHMNALMKMFGEVVRLAGERLARAEERQREALANWPPRGPAS